MTKVIPKRSPRSIQFMWISVIMLVSGIATALFTTLLIYYRTTDVIEATDARLLMAAEMAREIVGANFHDNITGLESVSKGQFEQIVARNDELCRRLHLQYLWSVLSVDDQLVFTSATHSDIEDPASPSAAFFEVHRDPESFRLAMGPEMNPVFSSFHNEWGEGRMVLIPRKDNRGRTYIFGASVQMDDYNAMLRQAALTAIAIGLVVMGGAFLLTVTLARRLTMPISQLTETADKMAGGDLEVSLPLSGVRELQSLSDSLDQLRHGLKKRITELIKRTALLDATQQLTKVGGWEWDVAQQSMFWTKEVYRIHGLSPEDISFGSTEHIDRSILCYEPDDRLIIQAAFQDCVEKGLSYDLEVPFTNYQGERIWVRTQAEAVSEGGKVIRVLGNIVDITERKLAEKQISESEEKYRLLVENANDIVYLLALDGVFSYVSPSWTRILGHPISEVENHSFQIFIHPDDIPASLEFLEKTITTGEKQAGIEYRVRHKNGTWRWHTSNRSPVFDTNGKVVSFLGIARDITDRKRLAEEQIYLSRLVDSSPASITIHDKNGKFLYANERTFKLHGYSRDEFMKINVHQLDVPESEVLLDSRIRQVMENGEVSFEASHFRKDGSTLPLHISARITELGGEQVIESIAIDLTERKMFENTLHESNEIARAILNAVTESVFLMDAEGMVLAANETTALRLGKQDPSLVGTNIYGLLPTEVAESRKERVFAVLSEGKPLFFEDERFGVWIENSIYPVFDADGEARRVAIYGRDITDRKKIESELRESEERYKSLHNASFGGIAIHDKGVILECNRGLSEMMGYPYDELIGMDGLLLITPNSREFVRHNIITGYEKPYEAFGLRKNGEIFPMRLEARNIPYKGKNVRTVEFRDITEQKLAEEKIREDQVELERLLEEAERSHQALLSVVEDQKEAQEQVQRLNAELEQRVQDRTAQLKAVNQELEAFSYSVSHDLRAPLRALDGFSSALISDYQETLDVQGRHYLARIQEASRRMGQLIEDLLNLSRISRREVKLNHVDLSQLARQIADDLKTQSPTQSVEFNISPGLIVQADPGLLKIALENLLHNALKYSSKKEIALIQVGVLGQPGPDGRVFYVRDNGAGFDMAYVDKLFTPFQRLHGTQEFSGTGIGLSIVQRIITRHGGRIWTEAAVNQGATFYFTLGGE